MRIGLLPCLPLLGIAACVDVDGGSPTELGAPASVTQAVTGAPEVICGINGPGWSGDKGSSCADPHPGVAGKVVEFLFVNESSIPTADIELHWNVPSKLVIIFGCGSNPHGCSVDVPTGSACGDTPLEVSVSYRDTRSASNPWVTLTATAHLKLGGTKACRAAVLETPACSVVMGDCAGTFRAGWVNVVSSWNSDDSRHTTVGISYTGGSEWCHWYELDPGETEDWMSSVPTYTLLGRVQTETDWDVSPYCTFYMNAMACGQQDP